MKGVYAQNEHGVDLGRVRFQGRHHIIVDRLEAMSGSLLVEPGPGVPAVAVDDVLQIDLADALQEADEKGIDGD